MLDALRFVSGAVSLLDTVPALSHYRIEAGFIMGFNGTVALCSPINLHIKATPHAEQLYRALKSCDATVAITQTTNGRLLVRAGAFSGRVDCLEDAAYPAVAPDGPAYTVKPGLCALFKKLLPIIGNDPTKLWMNGALLANGSITVTNGVVLAQAYTGDYMERACNVPATAIKELVRVGLDPIAIQWGAQSVTFHFENGRWLRTSLFVDPWPLAKIEALLASVGTPDADGAGYCVAPCFFPALKKLMPFCENEFARVELVSGLMTVRDSGRVDRAKMDLNTLEGHAVMCQGDYNARELMKLDGLADIIYWADYPKAVGWSGNGVRGRIQGLTAK